METPLTLAATFAQAQALLKSGRPADAAPLFHRILAQTPEQPDALHALGLMAQEAGHAAQALDYVRRACASPGAQPVYFSNLAEMCRRANRLPEGEAAARRAIHLNPAQAGAWNNLGIILQELAKYRESKTCLERVLALTPASPEAHNNYGNTCKRLGLLAEAERHWLRALELREEYPEPHSNLANLHSDLGAYDRAAYHARRAIALAPRFADAYINLALVESARGNDEAALAALDRLLAFAPRHATAMAAKAIALQQLDRLEDALPWARNAVAAAPDNAEAVHALGQLCQATGDPAAARQAYDRAAAMPGPVAEKAASSRAMLLMETGDAQAAAEAFQAAIKAYPRSVTLYHNRADLKRFTDPADPDLAAMLNLLQSGACESANDRMLLRFALGNAYLQLGDGASAFAHLDQANREKRATFSYDPEATGTWMRAIAHAFSAATMHRLAKPGSAPATPPSFAPVFVIGVPRSGTTLVEQILDSHPFVHGAGELGFLRHAVARHGEYPALAATLPAGTLHTIAETYTAAVTRRAGAALQQEHLYVVDKMPANFLFAGVIHLAFPQARIIHCRRDPVDTCLSCYSKLFTREQLFTYNQAELGRFHLDYQKLMAHWRSVLPSTHFLEVQYEDVVADIESQARRMLGFLGLDWDPACLAFHESRRQVRTASVNQVRQPIYKTSAGRWKRHAPYLAPLLAVLHPSA